MATFLHRVAHARTEVETRIAQQVVDHPVDAAAAALPHDARAATLAVS